MSSVIDLKLDGDGAWPDLKVKQDSGKLSWQGNGSVIRICCLSRGTESGRPTAAIRIDMRDGTAVVAEATVANLITALRAIEARYGGEVEKPRDVPHQN